LLPSRALLEVEREGERESARARESEIKSKSERRWGKGVRQHTVFVLTERLKIQESSVQAPCLQIVNDFTKEPGKRGLISKRPDD